ncbi:MAG TPA: branched-chain amino acid ABC transporter ATP-binding protein/permease [Acidimicrobiia bacterium]|nr:branched-chain amino acid ABC transporter ATP-binding protein/permease [Acidimicrobiia bacterium]
MRADGALRTFGPWVAVAVALAAYPFLVSPYWALIGSFVVIYSIVALSLTVLTGWAGAVSLSQAAFVGLGAFTAAELTTRGVNFALWIPIAMVLSVPASVVTGAVALRLPGLYFAVVTLAFGVVAQYMLFIPLENHGTTEIARPHWGSVDFGDERSFFLLCALLAALAFGACLRIGRGRTGRALLTVRTSRTAAEALAVDSVRYRTLAFVVSGCLASGAGVLLGTLIQSSRSNQFTLFASIQYLAVTFIGGIGSVLGAVLAGALQVLPTEIIRPFAEGQDSDFLRQFAPILQATLLLLVVVLRPDGIIGIFRSLGVRAGMLQPRPPREAAFAAPSTRARRDIGVSLPEWAIPPGTLAAAVGRAPAAVVDEPAGRAAGDGPPALEARDVSVRYGAVVALDAVSFSVQPGELVAIIGPNGAGKTTLFNCCSGFQAPDSGTVALHGVDVTGFPAHRRAAAGLGRSFQTPRLVDSMSVFENLLVGFHPRLAHGLPAEVAGFTYALAEEAEIRARAAALLDAVGLSAIGELAAGDLPSGLRKVVEVLRALVPVPDVLLLDEPSAGLDPHETRWLGRLIQTVNRELGVSVALIEHDMSLVMGISDYVYVLEFGRLLTAGSPAEVRSNPAVIAAYLGKEAQPA